MSNPRHFTVDIIDDAHYIAPALQAVVRAEPETLWTINRVESSWISYAERASSLAQVVIVSAWLKDHVPTLLKIRALQRAGSAAIVVGGQPTSTHIWRLRMEGAWALIPRTESLGLLLRVLSGERQAKPVRPEEASEVRLSDRQLQCAALFAGESAPSASVVSALLGLPHASVRTHIQRAREALGPVGAISTRAGLRSVLRRDGWILE